MFTTEKPKNHKTMMTEKLWAWLAMQYIWNTRYYIKNSPHLINAIKISPLLQNSYLVKHRREFEGRTVQSGTWVVINLLDLKALQVHHSEKVFQQTSEHNFTEQPGEQHECIPLKKKGHCNDTILIIIIIIHMKKLLDSDWLRAVQFKCNISAKSVPSVQKV